jgi:amino acid transporter
MKKLSLFSATAIGISAIVGSGWLFAGHLAAKEAGPLSIFSWFIGAGLALIIALLLAEIASIYQETGLLSRLFSLTHNHDYGFLIAAANWFVTIFLIPSEAAATIQYLAKSVPSITNYIFFQDQLTIYGTILVCILICIYGLLNYWGVNLLARINNIVTLVKLIAPAFVGIVIIFVSFHPINFTNFVANNGTSSTYGVGSIFKAVVSSGIFYAFYGFSMIAVFAKELDNPKKNIPIALASSILICLAIYLILQVAFIGAVDPKIVASGWQSLHFSSPLVDLSILIGLNWLSLILYTTATISPSGSGIIYTASGSRMLYAMATDHQMPEIFNKLNPKFFVSRTSLVCTVVLSMALITIFNNWQQIVVVVTVFQLISCIAVPISFIKLRQDQPDTVRVFKMPLGKTLSFLTYLFLTYLLTQCGSKALVFSLVVFSCFFLIYCFSSYRFNLGKIWGAFMSSWSLFAYMIFVIPFGYLHDSDTMNMPQALIVFIIASPAFYFLLIRQKSYNKA